MTEPTARMSAPRVREAALIAGIVSLLVTWWVWGVLSPKPIIADEQSYVLQSRIFASGHWTAPSPPIPEFFEQSVVLTTPAVASKMYPGHSLLLSLGSLVGVVALVPLLLTGLTGALLYLLVNRVANAWVAALALLIWLGDPINLRFRPSYYSEVTTQLLCLASWWALLEWRLTHARKWLLALAAAIGWGAFTRPLTILLFAIPIGVVVVRDVARLGAWRDFAMAFALGTIMLGVIPLWSAETTGDWKLTPLALYERDFLPFDKPGFGVDTTAPAKHLNQVNRFTYAEFYREHERHTPGNLPRIAFERVKAIANAEWSGPRMILVPFVLAGLVTMGPAIGFAVISACVLFLGYLSYGHFAGWTLYYFEAIPVFAVLAAVGLWRVVERAGAIRQRAVGTLLVVLCVALMIYEAGVWRADHLLNSKWNRDFDAMIAELPPNPTVIFVHYTPVLQPHPFIVANSPHLANEPVWIVNDLGDRDAELMKHAGGRVPIAFYEEGRRFEVDRRLLPVR